MKGELVRRRSPPAWAAKIPTFSPVTQVEATETSKTAKIPWAYNVIASLLAIAFGAVYFLWLAHWFMDVFATPRALNNDQRIMVMLDRSDVPLQLTTDLTEGFRNSQPDEISIRLSIDPSYTGPTVTAKVFFQGSGFGQDPSARRPSVGNCSLAVYAVPARAIDCTAMNMETYEPGLTLGPTQVVSTRLTPDDRTAVLYLDVPNAEWSASAGKRTAFALPRIGTADTHPSIASVAVRYPGFAPLYVPQPFNSVVLYREVEPSERVESSSPALALADTLAWQTDYYGLVSPRGSITDLGKEEKQATDTTVIGFLAGIGLPVIGLMRTALLLLGGRLQRIRNRKR